jgi:hypothetical protein
MCGLNRGAGAANAAANQAAEAEAARQRNINAGMQTIDQTFSQYGDDFFKGVANDYTNFALPQLDDQYSEARKTLAYRLADAGTSNSSAAGDQLARLERTYGGQKLQVLDDAQSYAGQVRSNLNSARAGVTSDLLSGGSAAQAQAAAARAAQSSAATPQFSPLAQIFQNVGSAVGTARAANQNERILSQAPIYKVSAGGSGRVVG